MLGVVNKRNNFKALILNLIIIIISFIFLSIFVATGPIIGQYSTNIIIRKFIGIAVLLAYIFVCTLLDKDKNKKYNFFIGCLIAVIGIALLLYTFYDVIFKTGLGVSKNQKNKGRELIWNKYYLKQEQTLEIG